MKEQMVIPRASRQPSGGGAAQKAWRKPSGGAASAATQKPAKRRSAAGGAPAGRGRSTRDAVMLWMPLAGKILLVMVAFVLTVSAYRAAASASFFQLRRLDVTGTNRASSEEIGALVKRMSAGGVWNVDLGAVRAEIKKRQGWVRDATVTRVLPDGLRVRVAEREPRAVMRTASGRLIWLDDEAVALGEVSPSMPSMPAFFIHGLDEAETDDARRENQERMRAYFEMARDWDAANLSERVSEVNLIDVRDVRAQLAGRDARVEVRLGKDNFGQRLRRALKALDDSRATPRGGAVTYIDATRHPQVTIGLNAAGAAAAGEGKGGNNGGTVAATTTTGNTAARRRSN